jgi:hypothetical membrane protein
MTQQLIAAAPGKVCDRETSTTKTLLAYGVLAGPVYVATSLGQALTRDGFDLTKHAWSLLSNGPYGWIQITNFVAIGLMTIALAVGLRRARVGTWAPRLIGVFGASMVAAGVFRADPAMGFPAGTPDGAGEVTWHGMLHFAVAGIGFTCLAAACLVLARRFAAEQSRGWARYSRVTGVLFLAGFVAMFTSGGAAWGTLTFVAAVVIVFTWVSALAARLYGKTA